MAQRASSPGFRRIATAVLDPLGAVVLGGAGLAFAVTHTLPILAVGGLAWGALVALKLTSSTKDAGPTQDELPMPAEFMDPAVKLQIGNLHRARAALTRVLNEHADNVGSSMSGALLGVPELEEHAITLAKRAEALNDYLRTQDRAAIAVEAKRLSNAASGASDRQARQEYGEAVAAVGEQLRALDDIANAQDRAVANLSRITAALQALPSKIVALGALDQAAQDALGDDVSADLGRLNEEVRAFEQTLSSMAAGVESTSATKRKTR